MSWVEGLGRRVPVTVVRFGCVGMANTLIDTALFWMLHGALGILLANFLSTSAGMLFSFWMNGRHTFGASRVTWRQAVLFVGTNGLTMWVLQPVLIALAYQVLSIPLLVAKVLAIGASVVANFLLYRYVVWPRELSSVVGRSGHPERVGEGVPS